MQKTTQRAIDAIHAAGKVPAPIGEIHSIIEACMVFIDTYMEVDCMCKLEVTYPKSVITVKRVTKKKSLGELL